SHRDGTVYHDRSRGHHVDREFRPDGTRIDHEYGRHGKHVDHEYRPDGKHVDHDYSRGGHVDYDRPRWSFDSGRDPYRDDRRGYHTHRRYDDDYRYDRGRRYSDRHYTRDRRYSRYDDYGDYGRDRYRYDRGTFDDPYYGAPGTSYPDPRYGYDSYYGTNGRFDWKQDWPLLLGTMFDARIGR
ncbi:MAG: hypothetical protein ACREQQ_02940, partial [Candidatus Binatia bacterium]